MRFYLRDTAFSDREKFGKCDGEHTHWYAVRAVDSGVDRIAACELSRQGKNETVPG
ncbi:MAG: hypothetical protein NVS3B20_07140 [Polyangiales bacterium]